MSSSQHRSLGHGGSTHGGSVAPAATATAVSPTADGTDPGAGGGVLDGAKQSAIARQVEDYNQILDTIGSPNYHAIKRLFDGSGCTPADTNPAINVSFELFEAVQTRFAATKQTLERTKADLLARNQQYTILQGELGALRDQHTVLQRRAAEAEERNTALHQRAAKQEVATEQLRRELGQAQVEMDQVRERLLRREEELRTAQNRVTEGAVLLSQKDAVVAALRRELGKRGRFKGSVQGGDGTEGDGDGDYSAEALQSIAADVEGRTQEARMKLSVADLEAKLRRAELEKGFVLEQHNEYLRHVELVVEAYESQCMALQDGVAGHACVHTPYFLTTSFHRDLMAHHRRVDGGGSAGGGGGGGEAAASGSGSDAERIRSFYTLSLEAHRCLDRLDKLHVDPASQLKGELAGCIAAQRTTLQAGADLVGFLTTFEKEVGETRLSLAEVREEWRRAQVPFVATRIAEQLSGGVSALGTALVQLLERENELTERVEQSERAAAEAQAQAQAAAAAAAATATVAATTAAGRPSVVPPPLPVRPAKTAVGVDAGTMTDAPPAKRDGEAQVSLEPALPGRRGEPHSTGSASRVGSPVPAAVGAAAEEREARVQPTHPAPRVDRAASALAMDSPRHVPSSPSPPHEQSRGEGGNEQRPPSRAREPAQAPSPNQSSGPTPDALTRSVPPPPEPPQPMPLLCPHCHRSLAEEPAAGSGASAGPGSGAASPTTATPTTTTTTTAAVVVDSPGRPQAQTSEEGEEVAVPVEEASPSAHTGPAAVERAGSGDRGSGAADGARPESDPATNDTAPVETSEAEKVEAVVDAAGEQVSGGVCSTPAAGSPVADTGASPTESAPPGRSPSGSGAELRRVIASREEELRAAREELEELRAFKAEMMQRGAASPLAPLAGEDGSPMISSPDATGHLGEVEGGAVGTAELARPPPTPAAPPAQSHGGQGSGSGSATPTTTTTTTKADTGHAVEPTSPAPSAGVVEGSAGRTPTTAAAAADEHRAAVPAKGRKETGKHTRAPSRERGGSPPAPPPPQQQPHEAAPPHTRQEKSRHPPRAAAADQANSRSGDVSSRSPSPATADVARSPDSAHRAGGEGSKRSPAAAAAHSGKPTAAPGAPAETAKAPSTLHRKQAPAATTAVARKGVRPDDPTEPAPPTAHGPTDERGGQGTPSSTTPTPSPRADHDRPAETVPVESTRGPHGVQQTAAETAAAHRLLQQAIWSGGRRARGSGTAKPWSSEVYVRRRGPGPRARPPRGGKYPPLTAAPSGADPHAAPGSPSGGGVFGHGAALMPPYGYSPGVDGSGRPTAPHGAPALDLHHPSLLTIHGSGAGGGGGYSPMGALSPAALEQLRWRQRQQLMARRWRRSLTTRRATARRPAPTPTHGWDGPWHYDTSSPDAAEAYWGAPAAAAGALAGHALRVNSPRRRSSGGGWRAHPLLTTAARRDGAAVTVKRPLLFETYFGPRGPSARPRPSALERIGVSGRAVLSSGGPARPPTSHEGAGVGGEGGLAPPIRGLAPPPPHRVGLGALVVGLGRPLLRSPLVPRPARARPAALMTVQRALPAPTPALTRMTGVLVYPLPPVGLSPPPPPPPPVLETAPRRPGRVVGGGRLPRPPPPPPSQPLSELRLGGAGAAAGKSAPAPQQTPAKTGLPMVGQRARRPL